MNSQHYIAAYVKIDGIRYCQYIWLLRLKLSHIKAFIH